MQNWIAAEHFVLCAIALYIGIEKKIVNMAQPATSPPPITQNGAKNKNNTTNVEQKRKW